MPTEPTREEVKTAEEIRTSAEYCWDRDGSPDEPYYSNFIREVAQILHSHAERVRKEERETTQKFLLDLSGRELPEPKCGFTKGGGVTMCLGIGCVFCDGYNALVKQLLK